MNTSGTLDTNFNPGNGITGGFPTRVHALALQPDGKILAGGDFTTVNGVGRNCIVRLNTDGSADTNFVDVGTGAHLEVRAIALQPDGKILIGGEFVTLNSTSRPHIARLNPNGTVDTTFDPGVGANGPFYPWVYSIAVQADGRPLIAGAFTSINRTGRWWVARLLGDAPLIHPPILMDDSITLNWNAITGRTYRVQFKQDLNATNWTDLPPDIIAPGNVASRTDTLQNPQRFYRVNLLSE